MKVIVKSSRNGIEVYHTRECNRVKKMRTQIETTKTEAEKRGLRECDDCKDEDYQKGVEKDLSYYEAAKNAGD